MALARLERKLNVTEQALLKGKSFSSQEQEGQQTTPHGSLGRDGPHIETEEDLSALFTVYPGSAADDEENEVVTFDLEVEDTPYRDKREEFVHLAGL